jgi:hypothetical protein
LFYRHLQPLLSQLHFVVNLHKILPLMTIVTHHVLNQLHFLWYKQFIIPISYPSPCMLSSNTSFLNHVFSFNNSPYLLAVKMSSTLPPTLHLLSVNLWKISFQMLHLLPLMVLSFHPQSWESISNLNDL